jgi:hypothetical protein
MNDENKRLVLTVRIDLFQIHHRLVQGEIEASELEALYYEMGNVVQSIKIAITEGASGLIRLRELYDSHPHFFLPPDQEESSNPTGR